jgi:glycosyltransferase involved in cell wall biosynthesis
MKGDKKETVPARPAYVLITAAKNESAFIPKTLDSVVNQTVLPGKWVIVDDGSQDATGSIVRHYLDRYDFIQLVSQPQPTARNFGAKARALRTALASLAGTGYEYIGNLDADVSFGETFYETLLDRFSQDPELGISGGVIWEIHKKKWQYAPSRPDWCVGGATHFFRRACFEDVGSGYAPLRYGGEDTVAEYCARDKGWKVTAMKDCIVYHYKPSVLISGKSWRAPYAMGRQEYHWGTGILFETAKCLSRCVLRPLSADGYARIFGYMGQVLTRAKRDVPDATARIVRRQQSRQLFGRVLGKLSSNNKRSGSELRMAAAARERIGP